MSRPKDTKIKKELLDKCLKIAIAHGSLNLSIYQWGKLSGTSARMLIYHFGSKAELDEQLTIQLDETMRFSLEAFLLEYSEEEKILLSFWHLVTEDSKFSRLAKLFFSITLGSQISKSTRSSLEKQSLVWTEMLRKHFKTNQLAETAFLLCQGAMIDYFLTGNKLRGRKSLENFYKLPI